MIFTVKCCFNFYIILYLSIILWIFGGVRGLVFILTCSGLFTSSNNIE